MFGLLEGSRARCTLSRDHFPESCVFTFGVSPDLPGPCRVGAAQAP